MMDEGLKQSFRQLTERDRRLLIDIIGAQTYETMHGKPDPKVPNGPVLIGQLSKAGKDWLLAFEKDLLKQRKQKMGPSFNIPFFL